MSAATPEKMRRAMQMLHGNDPRVRVMLPPLLFEAAVKALAWTEEEMNAKGYFRMPAYPGERGHRISDSEIDAIAAAAPDGDCPF